MRNELTGAESYQVELKYFDPSDNYWKYTNMILDGYYDKESHKKVGLDACRKVIASGGIHPSVTRINYC